VQKIEAKVLGVTESIFIGESVIVPLADVHHIELDKRDNFSDAIIIVMNGTTWNCDSDFYNNSVYIRYEEAERFKKEWCMYRTKIDKLAVHYTQGSNPYDDA
jgi:hypothetical protein